MIYYLVTSNYCATTAQYFRTWGKAIGPQFKLLFYEHLPNTSRLPAGTYIFSDIERLNQAQAELAARAWQDLASSGKQVRLLNHPTRSMRRYELLRSLANHGPNRFTIYRLTDLEPPRSFPVFIRDENSHSGPLTPLLHSQEELDAAVRQIEREGRSRTDKVIIEYCDTSDGQGIFRKYSAFVVGDRIIPTHIFFGSEWLLKIAFAEKGLSPAMLEEERRFVAENPHEQALREIAKLARIDYGRIDYGVRDGLVQVWEINTNPILPRLNYAEAQRKPVLERSTQNLNAAFEAINCNSSPRDHIQTSTYQGRLRRLIEFSLLRLPPYARVSLCHWQKLGIWLLGPSRG